MNFFVRKILQTLFLVVNRDEDYWKYSVVAGFFWGKAQNNAKMYILMQWIRFFFRCGENLDSPASHIARQHGKRCYLYW